MQGILESTFLYNPQGKRSYCHAPSLLETASGDLLVSWYMYEEDEHKDARLVMVRRKKGGSWETAQPFIGHHNYSEGNPVLFEEPGGRIWLLFVLLKGFYWTDAEMNGCYSTDGGITWSPSQRLWKERGMMVRHPPVLLKNGDLALPAYDEVEKKALVLTAHPPYDQWEILFKFAGVELLQPVLIKQETKDPGGSQLTLFFRPWSDPKVIWRSHSNNEGVSWSTPLRTPLPNPLSGIAAFTIGSHMAVVHNYTHEHCRYPLSISISRNRGVTWDDPLHLDTIEREVSYPAFQNGQGKIIHGVYTYNRKMIKYVALDEMRLLVKS